jgi:hypothetical protein
MQERSVDWTERREGSRQAEIGSPWRKYLLEMSRWSNAEACFEEELEVEGEVGDDGK